MRSAFSVIELAVVLVLITILAVMLIPVLEDSRVKATEVKCLGRVRQVAMAMVMYQSSERGTWPWARRSVCSEHPEWPDPTASLAALYPQYTPKVYLFQCPGTDDMVRIHPMHWDFRHCENFYVSPRGVATRPEDEGKLSPAPPSYFYDGGWPGGVSIPRNALPSRVVYGDECVHGLWESREGDLYWLGSSNHEGGGNFLFADQHVEWLKIQWRGPAWAKGRSFPYVPNPRVGRSRRRGARYAVPADTSVFGSGSQPGPHTADADLAGMMWVKDSWREF